MNRILNTGKSGLESFQKRIDVLADNIANAQTDGYKKVRVEFETLIRDEMKELRETNPETEEIKSAFIGTGVKTTEPMKSFEQGDLDFTGVHSDLAIEGEGFFGVSCEGELFFRRDLRFQISESGGLLDAMGNPVAVAHAKKLTGYDAADLEIGSNGEIIVYDDEKNPVNMGKIVLYDVDDRRGLQSAENDYYRPLDAESVWQWADERTVGAGRIKQGYVERSNVDLTEEMTNMIMFQRAYQVNTKSLEVADEMWSIANNIRR